MKKIILAGFVAGAVAIGTASASSLGELNDVTVASTTITVDDCELDDVDFRPAQKPQDGRYFVKSITFTLSEDCENEALDFRLYGDEIDNGSGSFGDPDKSLYASFDNALPAASGGVVELTVNLEGVADVFIEDIEHLTVAVH